MCMSDKSRDAWPEAIADDDASVLWSCEKQFSTKNRRKLQENHNVFNEYSRQNADAIDQFRPGTKHLLREAQIVQSNIRQHEWYRSVIGTHNRNSTSYNLSDQKKVSESPGPQAIQMSRLL